jgi:hypothetical protein
MSKAKLINYAYPTSETAVKSGHGKTGCYYISTHETETSWKELERSKPFQHKKDAIAHADTILLPYHTWHYKYFAV